MSRITLLAVLASALLAQACSDPASVPPAGNYTAQVTGDVARALRGGANVLVGQSGYGVPTISLELGAGGAGDRISLVIARNALPSAGDYEIGEFASEPVADKWIGAYQLSENNQQAGYFTTLGGLVRITHSSAGRLKGTFALDAHGFLDGASTEPLTIVIEGTFDAVLVSR